MNSEAGLINGTIYNQVAKNTERPVQQRTSIRFKGGPSEDLREYLDNVKVSGKTKTKKPSPRMNKTKTSTIHVKT